MTDSQNLKARCPECGSELVIDPRTGEVLLHKPLKKPIAGGRDFDSLFSQLEEERAKAEETFEREKAAQKDRSRLLDEKFKEAMRRAEEEDDGSPPPRPFDLD